MFIVRLVCYTTLYMEEKSLNTSYSNVDYQNLKYKCSWIFRYLKWIMKPWKNPFSRRMISLHGCIDETSGGSGGTHTNNPRVAFQIKKTMMELYQCGDHTCQKCLDNYKYYIKELLSSGDENTRRDISEKIFSSGFLEIFQHYWNNDIQKEFLKKGEKNNSLVSMLKVVESMTRVIERESKIIIIIINPLY